MTDSIVKRAFLRSWDEPIPAEVEKHSPASSNETVGGSSDLEQDGMGVRMVEKEGIRTVTWQEPGGIDKRNPQSWSKARRWLYTALVCHMAFNVTFASCSPSAVEVSLIDSFNVNREVSTLIISLFLLGYVTGPIIWSPMSEHIGRRTPLLLAFFINAQFVLGQALGQNIQTVLITRFLSGIFAAAPLTLSAAIIVDMWDPYNRVIALSIFTASVQSGTGFGPMMGGYVTQSIGWRYVFWILYGYDMVSWLVVFLCVPETYSPVLLTTKASKYRKSKPKTHSNYYSEREIQEQERVKRGIDTTIRAKVKRFLQQTLLRPWLILLQEPIMWLVTAYQSLIFGLLYGLLELVPIIWGEMHDFSLGEVGLIFLFLFVGTTMGALTNILINIRMQAPFRRSEIPDAASLSPESKMKGTQIAAPIMAIGIFWLGWTGWTRSIPWYVPALALVPTGFSFALIFITTNTYVVEVYAQYSASALAASTMTRSLCAFAFPLFIRQAAHNIGVQYTCTIFGICAATLCPIPFIFARYGKNIRARSKFKP